MSIYSMYFSPAGGTKKVTDVVAAALGNAAEVDLSRPDADYGREVFGAEDVCVIGVPSFGGRVPGVILERMMQMHVDGARAVLIAVYGNRAIDDTLAELSDVAKECGFQVAAAVSAVAEHSIMRQFGAGRPDARDIEELKGFAAQIKERLEMPEACDGVVIPGNRPYRAYGGVPFKPAAGKRCNRCGICASLCPVQAIPRDHPDSVDSSVCISCMRCVRVCPQHARTLNPVLLFAASKKMEKACKSRKGNELFL